MINVKIEDYTIETKELSDEDGGGFAARIVELNCIGDGDTVEEAIKNVYEIGNLIIEQARLDGIELPNPISMKAENEDLNRFENHKVEASIPEVSEEVQNEINKKKKSIRNSDVDENDEQDVEVKDEDFYLPKETKNKKFSLFSNKKQKIKEPKVKKERKKKTIEQINDVELTNELNGDKEININDEEIVVNELFDIESAAKQNKPFVKKPSKKIMIALLIALAIIILLFVATTAMIKMSNKKITETPGTTVEITNPEINPNIASMTKQGLIKRVLGNKVIITPDGETEDVVYYITSSISVDSFETGKHIEYEYMVEDYVPKIVGIRQITKGKVVYKGIMTITVESNSETTKYSYLESLEDKVKTIVQGDSISFVSQMIEEINTITDIFEITKQTDESIIEETTENQYTPSSGYIFDKTDFYNEYLVIENRQEEPMEVTSSNIKDNTIAFQNNLTKPVWIRFAWRVTDLAETVPGINNIAVTLASPSGKIISSDNISEYGRMWTDGNIVNFAIRAPEVGEYKIITAKPKGTNLGEAQVFVMELSGFITIEKFGANLIDQNNLELIWNVGGVPDDGMEIEVHLTNERFSTMVYSGSSKTENLHIVDKRTVDVSHLPKGKYNIIVKVKDLDIKTREDSAEIDENTLVISAETISETKNMGVLILQ